jgi:putative phage-type endonuclease
MEQQTNEWIDFRKNHIGASDIAAIIGISPWKTAYTLWLEKTGKKKEDDPNIFMLKGQEIEAEAREAYMKLTGNIVMPSVCTSEKWDIAAASLDGVSEDGSLIVEIKHPSSRIYEMATNGKIPEYYECQIQWQLWVNERAKEGDYFCYKDKDQQALITIYPDKTYQEELVRAAKEFWECIQNDTPPEIKEEDYILIEDKEFTNLAKKYIKVDGEIKNLESEKKKLKLSLIDFSDDGNTMGGGVRLKKQDGKKIIDWKKVCEKYKISKEDLEKHTSKRPPFWTIFVQ